MPRRKVSSNCVTYSHLKQLLDDATSLTTAAIENQHRCPEMRDREALEALAKVNSLICALTRAIPTNKAKYETFQQMLEKLEQFRDSLVRFRYCITPVDSSGLRLAIAHQQQLYEFLCGLAEGEMLVMTPCRLKE